MKFTSLNKQGEFATIATSTNEKIQVALQRINYAKGSTFQRSVEYDMYLSMASILDEVNVKNNLGRSSIDYLLYKNVVDRYRELGFMYANVFGIQHKKNVINFKLSELKNFQEANNLDLSWLEFSEK